MGNAAVKAAFLHVCAVLNASTQLEEKEKVIKALQAGAAAMVAGEATTAEVSEQRVMEFRDELPSLAAEHGISPPAVIVRSEKEVAEDEGPLQQPFAHTAGLSLLPEEFLRMHLKRPVNRVDEQGNSITAVDNDPGDEPDEARTAKKARWFGKGKKALDFARATSSGYG